jgi:hypothetical protein
MRTVQSIINGLDISELCLLADDDPQYLKYSPKRTVIPVEVLPHEEVHRMHVALCEGISFLKDKLAALLIHSSESSLLPSTVSDLTLDLLRKIERSFRVSSDLYPLGKR